MHAHLQFSLVPHTPSYYTFETTAFHQSSWPLHLTVLSGHLLDLCACVGNQLQALPVMEELPRLFYT